MKALKCFAVCTALLVMGACSTAPKEESDFLNIVKGKMVVIGGADYAKFSDDGKRADLLQEPKGYGQFEKAEANLTAYYQSYDKDGKKLEGASSKFKAVLKADKTGGEMSALQADNTYPTGGLSFTLK